MEIAIIEVAQSALPCSKGAKFVLCLSVVPVA
jgi:hypothetical protein